VEDRLYLCGELDSSVRWEVDSEEAQAAEL
jgi:hypothetical protein